MLLRTPAEVATSRARIEEADAAAERTHQAQLRALQLQRQRDAEADRRIAEEAKTAARAERRARRQRRATGRRDAVRAFRVQLPARLILVPVCLAVAAAWRGQEDWAVTGLHWSFVWAAGLATALETLGLALGAMARSARNDDDSAIVERALMWAVVCSAAWLNWQHSRQPVLGLMSIAGVAGWEVYERRRYRHLRTGDRPTRRPRFGAARWARFTLPTFTAWSVAIRDRLGPEDAVTALDRAATERAKRKAFSRRQRRRVPVLVRQAVEAGRAASVERAEMILQEAEATIGAAALLLGPGALREAVPAAEQVAESRGGRVASSQEPPRRLRRRLRLVGRKPAPAADTTAGTAEDSAPGTHPRTAPKRRAKAAGTTTRARGRGARRARQDTTGVDIADLWPAALEIVAKADGRLTRDRLIQGLRGRGLTVGGKRRAAVWQAVKDYRSGGATEATA